MSAAMNANMNMPMNMVGMNMSDPRYAQMMRNLGQNGAMDANALKRAAVLNQNRNP